jgi:flagellar protein FlgJ
MNIASTIATQDHNFPKVESSADRFRAASKETPKSVADAQKVHDKFSEFVGEAFYGQIMKSMRSTVGKPAYFNGGRGEEVFQSQLDQHLAQEFARDSGDRFAEPMFEQQFPHHAKILREAKQQTGANSLDNLNNLRRF